MKIKSEKRLLMTNEIMQNGIEIEFLKIKFYLRVNDRKLKLELFQGFERFYPKNSGILRIFKNILRLCLQI